LKKIENYSNKLLMFEVARLRTMFNKFEKDTFEGKEGKWITLDNGQHIFIREGEELSDALGRLKPEKLPKAPKALMNYDRRVMSRLNRKDPGVTYVYDKAVDISDINLPESRSEYRLKDNKSKIKETGAVPPILLVFDSNTQKFDIEDGVHRTNAAKELGYSAIPAVITYHENEKSKEKQKIKDNLRDRIVKRYKLIVDEYNSRNLRWYWSKHELDKLIKDEFEGHKGKWITLENGQHIFVREGESLGEATGRLREKPVEETFIEAYDKHTKNYLKNNVPVEKISREKFKETTGIDAPEDSNVFYSMGRRKIYFLEGAEATPELMHHEGHHAIWFSRASPIPGFKDDPNLEPQIKAFKKATRDEGPVTAYSESFELSRDRHTYYGENFAEAGQLYRLGKEGKEKLAKYPMTYKAYEDYMTKFEEDEKRRTT